MIKTRHILLLSLILISGCSKKVYYHLPPHDRSRVVTGLENFIDNLAPKYRGKKAIVVTNHSGVDFNLTQNIALLRQKGIEIAFVLAPEHGIYGYENAYDKKILNVEGKQNFIIYNLHLLDQNSLRHLLKISDIVLFDIQDMGMRCYTYISSLKFVIDCMKGSDRELIVLDRPNPLGFLGLDGAVLDQRLYSRNVSAFPSPFLYNMTIGEAALFYKGGYAKDVNLRVIPLRNYSREMLYSGTSLPWIPPSPNLPTYESAIIYSGVVLLEGINISLGRGTSKPFEYLGAPWIEPNSFCEGLRKLGLGPFRFRPIYFEPTFSKYRGMRCGGAQIFYVGGRFSPFEVSYKIIKYIKETYREFHWERAGRYYDIDYLAGTDLFKIFLESGKSYAEYAKETRRDVEKFNTQRVRYTIY